MSFAEGWHFAGQVISLSYAALIFWACYSLATAKEDADVGSKMAVILVSLALLPVLAGAAFSQQFFTNGDPGQIFYWPSAEVFSDYQGLFSNETKLSTFDISVFFLDQTLRAVFFDFFDIFQWKLSALEYNSTHVPANVFIFAYRTLCSLTTGALLIHVLNQYKK